MTPQRVVHNTHAVLHCMCVFRISLFLDLGSVSHCAIWDHRSIRSHLHHRVLHMREETTTSVVARRFT